MLKPGYVKHGVNYHGHITCIHHFICDNNEVGQFRIAYLKDCYWIYDFYIKPKYRGFGFAQKMLQECINTFNNKPLMCYGFDNAQLLHIAQKHNFKIVTIEYCGHKRTIRRYHMRREVK